jgi:hypothetical protein
MGVLTLDAPRLIEATSEEVLDDLLLRICRPLQLSEAQYALARSHYGTICDWLGDTGSILNSFAPDLYPQGSVALGTTVKPLRGEEYDVDLVCQLAIDRRSVAWPVVLLDLIERRMRENEGFRGRLERKKRCLRVNYAHDFHLDILPACPDLESGGTCLVIPDREDKGWQATNPRGYAEWFRGRGALRLAKEGRKLGFDSAAPLPRLQTAEEKTTLQVCVQLVKRWRDILYATVPDLAPVSIVLTTLLGNHYIGEQSIIRNLVSSADAILGSLPASGRLVVTNPTQPKEDLSERWENGPAYYAFVGGVQSLKSKLAELLATSDMGRRSEILQSMFGEQVAKSAFSEQAGTIEKFRNSQRMGIGRLSSGAVALSSASAAPIPRNTFYGGSNAR